MKSFLNSSLKSSMAMSTRPFHNRVSSVVRDGKFANPYLKKKPATTVRTS